MVVGEFLEDAGDVPADGTERAHRNGFRRPARVETRTRAAFNAPVDLHEKVLEVARDADAGEQLVDAAHRGRAEGDGPFIVERREPKDAVQQSRRRHVLQRHPAEQLVHDSSEREE